MTSYTYQAALIVPAAQLDAAQRIAEAMGWGPGNYAVSLNDGAYRGLSAPVTQTFVDMMTAAGEGTVPEGVDPADLSAVMGALLSSIEPRGARTQREQFDALCADNGLSVDVTTEDHV